MVADAASFDRRKAEDILVTARRVQKLFALLNHIAKAGSSRHAKLGYIANEMHLTSAVRPRDQA